MDNATGIVMRPQIKKKDLSIVEMRQRMTTASTAMTHDRGVRAIRIRDKPSERYRKQIGEEGGSWVNDVSNDQVADTRPLVNQQKIQVEALMRRHQ